MLMAGSGEMPCIFYWCRVTNSEKRLVAGVVHMVVVDGLLTNLDCLTFLHVTYRKFCVYGLFWIGVWWYKITAYMLIFNMLFADT